MKLMKKEEIEILTTTLSYSVKQGYVIDKSNRLTDFGIDLNILTSKNNECNYCMYKQIIDENEVFYYLTSDILGLKYVLHAYYYCFELKSIY